MPGDLFKLRLIADHRLFVGIVVDQPCAHLFVLRRQKLLDRPDGHRGHPLPLRPDHKDLIAQSRADERVRVRAEFQHGLRVGQRRVQTAPQGAVGEIRVLDRNGDRRGAVTADEFVMRTDLAPRRCGVCHLQGDDITPIQVRRQRVGIPPSDQVGLIRRQIKPRLFGDGEFTFGQHAI